MITEYKTNSLLDTIIAGIQEKKGKDIISLDFEKIENPVCRYFVICNGDSNTHVNAIADSIEEFTAKKLDTNVWHSEGRDQSHWIILDYSDIVVHVFQKHYREYYDLEDLWADCNQKEYDL